MPRARTRSWWPRCWPSATPASTTGSGPHSGRADRTDDERIVAAPPARSRPIAVWPGRLQRNQAWRSTGARFAGDARARPAGPAGRLSRLAPEGLEPRGSDAVEPGLVVGHDQVLGWAFDRPVYSDRQQRTPGHLCAICRSPQPARHPASPHRLQPPEGNSYIERFHRS